MPKLRGDETQVARQDETHGAPQASHKQLGLSETVQVRGVNGIHRSQRLAVIYCSGRDAVEDGDAATRWMGLVTVGKTGFTRAM